MLLLHCHWLRRQNQTHPCQLCWACWVRCRPAASLLLPHLQESWSLRCCWEHPVAAWTQLSAAAAVVSCPPAVVDLTHAARHQLPQKKRLCWLPQSPLLLSRPVPFCSLQRQQLQRLAAAGSLTAAAAAADRIAAAAEAAAAWAASAGAQPRSVAVPCAAACPAESQQQVRAHVPPAWLRLLLQALLRLVHLHSQLQQQHLQPAPAGPCLRQPAAAAVAVGRWPAQEEGASCAAAWARHPGT